ncbi:fam-b protein [Plasmodium vinckei lentum]|uniref:Fam-b protein n=1 Tax=Plasmodium vinckei lentum TaxID=138297 RepID=A0A6V7SGD7_PLAVN|nr:fam-b protein [Plasmodium vinckei lentum]
MIVSILKFVLFSIIICSYEYAQNELYFINERNIYIERNIINFKNNRILADRDNQFDLYDFYESNLSLANQFSDYIDDDEEITNLRNVIDSHIKNHKESNTLPNLNNVDGKTKKLIYELQKELEEVKTELDNIRNGEIPIQPIQEKGIIGMDENISVLHNEESISEKRRKEVNNTKILEKEHMKLFKQLLLVVGILVIAGSGMMKLLLLLVPLGFLMCKTWNKISIYRCKLRFPYR